MPRREKIKDRTGEKHITTEGCEVEIIEYFGCENCTIKFEDGTVIKNRDYGNIKKGYIKNPFHKSVEGVGYYGIGKYGSKTHSKIYRTWNNMLKRSYCKKYQEKFPTYVGCQVGENWHNFQVFAKWYEDNYVEGFYLDKDILRRGNKIYIPETCCFVPNEINILFTKRQNCRGKYPIGTSKQKNRYKAELSISSKTVCLGYYKTIELAFQAYKTTKESQIKQTAEKYKNQITEQTYQALINYKVEITD